MQSTMIWYELLTRDPDAAANFYGKVFGWTAQSAQQPGMDYRMFLMNGTPIGGHMKLPSGAEGAGMRPCWLGYVSVEDVDASVAHTVKAGGAVHMPAMDIEKVGRTALVADPQGASVYVMTPIGTGPATSFAPGKPGHGGWHELHTSNGDAALEFYREQFGWQKVDSIDMGAMGSYLLFNFGSGDTVGGMMNNAQLPRPAWLYYFNVDDIQAGTDRVQASGGKVLMGPHQVPGGSWITQAQDPQGAWFALLGPKT